MVVQEKLVELAICFSDHYDIFLKGKVSDTRQNHWTMKYSSRGPENSTAGLRSAIGRAPDS